MDRRKFLNRTTAAAATLPFMGLSMPAVKPASMADRLSQLTGENYWKALREEFPMPADEAYFNTGTMGAQF